MTHPENFLPISIHQALLAALAHVKPDPATGRVEPWCFVEALGEVANIWPASVLDDHKRKTDVGQTDVKSRKKR